MVDSAPMKSLIRSGAAVLAVTALSIAGAPAAQAATGVCNQASPHFLGGGFVALDPPTTSPAARYTVDLEKLPGKGVGLWTATEGSPALSICHKTDDDVVVYLTGADGTTDVTDVTDAIVEEVAIY